MKTFFGAMFLLAGLVALPIAAPADDGGGLEFKAKLSGDAEVPPVVTSTRGKAEFDVKRDLTRIEFELEVYAPDPVGLLGAAGAHIHCAPEGVNGPVVAPLAGVVTGGLDGKLEIEATLTEANIVDDACGATIAELVDAMLAGDAYVNVHSLANPSGEVRGQIAPDDDDHGECDDNDGDDDDDDHSDGDDRTFLRWRRR